MVERMTPDEIAAYREEQQAQESEDSKLYNLMRDETETDIFDHASAKDEPDPLIDDIPGPTNDGDRSLEDVEDDISGDEPENEETEEPPEDEQQESEEQEEPREDRSVPGHRYREERQRNDELQRRLAELEMRQQYLQPQYQQPQQPPPQPQQPPDMFVDPNAYTQYIFQQARAQTLAENIDRSLGAAQEEFGDDCRYIYQTLQSAINRGDPQAMRVRDAIFTSYDPGRALMRWGDPLLQDLARERERAREEIGRQWYRDKFGRDYQERRNQGEFNESTPQRSGTRTMPSLNSAAGNGRNMARERMDTRGMNGSDEDIFDYASRR
jgi:hypothetical protein